MKVQKQRIRFSKILLIILLMIGIAGGTIVGWPYFLRLFNQPIADSLSESVQIPAAFSQLEDNTPDTEITTSDSNQNISNDPIFNEEIRLEGVIVFSMADGLHNSLFLYHPQYLTFKRITNPNSDDIDPAISPDGSQIAFSSRRNGYWDIYLLNMKDASLTKVTNTPEYEGHPSWSPDGQWLVYEKYLNNNFDIYLHALDQIDAAPINLTQSPSNEFSPQWSPTGRILAYLSDQDGSNDVWIADLNSSDNRFVNISNSNSIEESNPVWLPSGTTIAWSATVNGYTGIYQSEFESRAVSSPIAEGDQFIWSPEGTTILSIIDHPNGSSINYYQQNGIAAYPSQFIQKKIKGMDWKSGPFVDNIIHYPFSDFSNSPQATLWEPEIDTYPLPPLNRYAMVPLTNVSAPYAYLHEMADESFDALRKSIAKQAGWDVLNSLENAFIPITVPSEIWNNENWFYTGRAIAINSSPIDAGWMILSKEEIDAKTYWRVFIKCRYQDGSQGMPIKSRSFDLDARLSGDPEIYEQGGRTASIPIGYWIDFTELAYRFDWERTPASIQWETYYPAARFNVFIFRQNLDWSQAMQEIIPMELIPTKQYENSKSIKTPSPALSNENGEIPPTTNAQIFRPTWTAVPGFDKP